MRASLFIVLMLQLCCVTFGDSRFLGELGRLLQGDEQEVFAPCKDDSKPVCPDGSKPDISSRPPSCSSGSPMCADGSTPWRSPAEDGSNRKDGCQDKGGKAGKGGKRSRRLRSTTGHDGREGGNPQERDSEECAEANEGMPAVLLASAIGGSVFGLCICVGICLFCRRRCVQRTKEPPHSKSIGHAVAEPDAAFVVGQPLESDMQNPKIIAVGAPYKLGA